MASAYVAGGLSHALDASGRAASSSFASDAAETRGSFATGSMPGNATWGTGAEPSSFGAGDWFAHPSAQTAASTAAHLGRIDGTTLERRRHERATAPPMTPVVARGAEAVRPTGADSKSEAVFCVGLGTEVARPG
jgi:hypothetical protein